MGMWGDSIVDEGVAAANSGQVPPIQAFLEKCPKWLNCSFIEWRRGTFLSYACEMGHEEVVEYLLTLPDIDLNTGMPLNNAMDNNHVRIVHMLVQRNAPFLYGTEKKL